jgi:guanine nucleotide-binding protein G(I)/G(S)/G(T) subunit beta-1
MSFFTVDARIRRSGSMQRRSSRRLVPQPADVGRERFQEGFRERLSVLQVQVEALKERIEGQLRAREEDVDWASWGSPPENLYDLRVRRVLEGHRERIYSLDWSADNVSLASASIDGKVIVWDAYTRTKRGLACLESPWIMTTAFDHDSGSTLLVGGVDSVISVFDVEKLLALPPSSAPTKPACILEGHTGYVTSASFLSSERVISGSGDGTLGLWDVRINQLLAQYKDHGADVTSVATHPHDPFMAASSSVDKTLRLWDLRAREHDACVRVFTGFRGDVNDVEIFRNGFTIAGCSADSTLRLFDMRSTAPLGSYTDLSIKNGASALTVSASGGLVVVAYDRNEAVAWEITSSEGTFHELVGHSARVTCLSVNPAGQALALGSWDKRVTIWC